MSEKKRVLITGVSRFLGLRLAKHLEEAEDVERVIGVDTDEPPMPIGNLDFVKADISSPLIARVLDSTRVDTIVHTNIGSSPISLGGRSQMKENNIIGTMQLLAAAQRTDRLKKVVVKSSTAIYGSSPGEPSLIPEDHAARQVSLSGYAKDCSEAEQYTRDFGRRRPDVELVILRPQNVVGPTVSTSMTDYFSLPVIPTALGYDPRIQLLHEEDAVEGFFRAMSESCRGIFNLSGDGVVYLSKAIRMMGKLELPLLTPFAQTAAETLRRFGLVDFPTDQLRLILFGRVVDTSRAKKAFGFAPRYTTEQSLIDLRDKRTVAWDEPEGRPMWEQDVIEYLRTRVQERESV